MPGSAHLPPSPDNGRLNPWGGLWLLALAVVLGAARWAVAPDGPTTWDEANGCFGVWDFDVLQHRPQPPGYPLWILAGKGCAWLTGAEHSGLVLWSTACAGISIFPMHALGREVLQTSRAAWEVTLLYAFNPLAWSFGSRALSGSTSLLLAPLISLLLIRAWRGDRKALLWGSVVVGLAGGFRQDLLTFLAPAWVFAWARHRNWLPPVVFVGAIATWAVPLVIHCGGLVEYLQSTDYMKDILRAESLLVGGSAERAAATAHRVLAAIALALGPVGIFGLIRGWRAPARNRFDGVMLIVLVAPCLAFCLLGYFHKKAYLFTVLPVLLLFAARMLQGRPSWVNLGVLATAYFWLPSTESVYAREDGYLERHAELGFPWRLTYPWLDASHQTARDRERRLGQALDLIRLAEDEVDDLQVVVPSESPVSFRQLMWARRDVPIWEATAVWRTNDVVFTRYGLSGLSRRIGALTPGPRYNTLRLEPTNRDPRPFDPDVGTMQFSMPGSLRHTLTLGQ